MCQNPAFKAYWFGNGLCAHQMQVYRRGDTDCAFPPSIKNSNLTLTEWPLNQTSTRLWFENCCARERWLSIAVYVFNNERKCRSPKLVYFLWGTITELTRISPDVRTDLSCSKNGLSIYMNSFSTLMEFMSRSRRRKRDMMEEDEEE